MPTLTAGATLDMTVLDRDALAELFSDGTVESSTPTEVIIQHDLEGYTVRHVFAGAGLSLGADGRIATGTITSYTLLDADGQAWMSLTGLSITAAELAAAIDSPDPNVLLDLLFGGHDSLTGGDDFGVGDTLTGRGGDDVINGGAGGGDLLLGGGGDDVIVGGDEAIASYSSYDGIDGGAGDDQLSGGDGNDVILGGTGADSLDGGLGNDILYHDGGAIQSRMSLVSYSPYPGFPQLAPVRTYQPTEAFADDGTVDTLNGGAGLDYIYAGLGDHVDGGDDYDTLDINFGARATALTLDLAGGPAAVSAASGGTIANIETIVVRGSAHGDTVSGSTGADRVYGGEGADHLSGGDSNDQLFGASYGLNTVVGGLPGHAFDDGDVDVLSGGGGNDTLHAGLSDSIDGGEGTDFLYLTLVGRAQGVNLDLTTGDMWATLATAAGGSLSGMETLSWLATTQFDDTIRVAGQGSFYTLGGHDVVHGDAAIQFVGGGEGDDEVWTYGGGRTASGAARGTT